MMPVYFGVVITLFAYMIGVWLKNKTGWDIMNPFLTAVVIILAVLILGKIPYGEYEKGASYISGFLTPATVCLAIPLYKQIEPLKKNLGAVLIAIFTGVISCALCIFVFSKLFGLDHTVYVSILPKSITTPIGMAVSEEQGGIIALTIVSILFSGISGSMMAEILFKVIHLTDPIAKGLALGTASHAIGTAKALELGEVEGAMSSLSIAVCGIMTVLVVPFVAGLI